jgi:dTDP-4-dehydrorhamnose reductase
MVDIVESISIFRIKAVCKVYLIIGANGFIGAYMIKKILTYSNEMILATANSNNHLSLICDKRVQWRHLDVSDFAGVDLLSEDTAITHESLKIIYLAAYHHPDQVEKNLQFAWHINITCLSYFINKFYDTRCFFYPSTEMVYGDGGENKKFNEESSLNPLNLYGKHKKIAEEIVYGAGKNVLRFPVLMGPSLLMHKKHFYDCIIEDLSQGKRVEMFSDMYKSMLDFDTVAKITITLMESYTEDMAKCLNVSGDESLSKYDVGVRIAQKHGYPTNLIRPISLSDDNAIFAVKRPRSVLLDNAKVKKLLHLEEIRMKFE